MSVVERVLGATGRRSRQAVYAVDRATPSSSGATTGPRWPGDLAGDRGARPYLRAHGVTEVECGDLHHGRDDDGDT